jgi:hypothetical protein
MGNCSKKDTATKQINSFYPTDHSGNSVTDAYGLGLFAIGIKHHARSGRIKIPTILNFTELSD